MAETLCGIINQVDPAMENVTFPVWNHGKHNGKSVNATTNGGSR
jgi:hypothetical protein